MAIAERYLNYTHMKQFVIIAVKKYIRIKVCH